MIPYQIPELPDICRWNKTTGYKVMFEDIGNPFCVFLVGFLAANCFDILWMCQNDFTVCFKDIVNRDPMEGC